MIRSLRTEATTFTLPPLGRAPAWRAAATQGFRELN